MLIKETLDNLLDGFIKKGLPGCSLNVVKDDKELYRGYFGYSDIENKRSIDKDTIFRIYSMTKVITCAAALKLYEKGLFLLNDPLEEYLPEFKDINVHRITSNGEVKVEPAKNSIRIKDLFSMTSGITYNGDQNETAKKTTALVNALSDDVENFTTRNLSKGIAAIPLAFEPGSHWLYGFSHDIIGALIEVISGKSFGDYLEEEIFKPLSMKDTSFKIDDSNRDRICGIYNRSDDGSLSKSEDAVDLFMPELPYESGGGGLLSTLDDYSNFAKMMAAGGEFNGERILSPHTLRLMATNHLGKDQMLDFDWDHFKGYGYGLGVRVMIDPSKAGSNSSLGEYGWSGMAGTWTLFDPKENLSVVYMQQMLPSLEDFFAPRLRAAIYGLI